MPSREQFFCIIGNVASEKHQKAKYIAERIKEKGCKIKLVDLSELDQESFTKEQCVVFTSPEIFNLEVIVSKHRSILISEIENDNILPYDQFLFQAESIFEIQKER
jgi:hypothetical protein